MREVLQRLRSELGGLLAGTTPGSTSPEQLLAFIKSATESIAIICGGTAHHTGGLEPRASGGISPSAAAVIDTPAKVDSLPMLGVRQMHAVAPSMDTRGQQHQQQHAQAGAHT